MSESAARLSRLVAALSIAGAIVSSLAIAAPAWIGELAAGAVVAAADRADAVAARGLVLRTRDASAAGHHRDCECQPAALEGSESSNPDHDVASTAYDAVPRSAVGTGRGRSITGSSDRSRCGADPFLARGPPRV